MAITKLKDGRYKLSFRPYGYQGKHIRRIFNTKSEAVRFENDYLHKQTALHDNSKLSVLAGLWFDYFGSSLKSGQSRFQRLLTIIDAMGDSRYSAFKPAHYLAFRTKRLNSGISANTCNHDLAYLKTVFSKLAKADMLAKNVLADVSPLSFDERVLTFLTLYQVKRLLVACRSSRNESLFPVVLFILRTGARWTEAEQLRFSQLFNNSVRFEKTKSGKSRIVPLEQEYFKSLVNRPSPSDRVFANCYMAFRNAVKNAGLILPPGQSSHVLRHTFASHFVMNGGDILTLQKILGHSDLKITMQYSHLSPDYLKQAVKYVVI